VVIPELVEDKWYEYFLHNQRGGLLDWALLIRGNERVFAMTAPWYVGGTKLIPDAVLRQSDVLSDLRK
jgi:hypothetical protein